MLDDTARLAARRFGDAAAFVAAGGWALSYRDVDRLSDEAALGLSGLGLGPGDVMALAMPSLPEYVVAYVAAAKLGAITAGVNDRLSQAERAAVLEVAGPRLVLATAEQAPDTAPPGATVVEVTPAGDPGSVLAGLRSPGPAPPPLPPDPDRPVTIVFTSGTTGTPKGAVFANRQLEAITAVDTANRWGAGGRGLAGTSFAHLGFMTKLPGTLRGGGTTFLVRRWRAAEALELTARHRLTTTGGIPTQVALMLQVADFDSYDLSSVKVVVFGGGPATAALVREARERFAATALMRYTCTEAGIGLGTSLEDAPEDAELTVGRPRAGVELSIRDGAQDRLPAGEVGEVCLRSAAVMSGYYRDPRATREALTADGAVRTGDMGWVDDRRRLHLVGRSKEMYVRGGENVYPVEVEGVLAEHPAVAEITVVPRGDDVMGQIGVAVVVPRPGPVPGLEDLRRFGARRLASFKLPEALALVESLPRNAMEKIDRAALAETAARAPGRRPGAPAVGPTGRT